MNMPLALSLILTMFIASLSSTLAQDSSTEKLEEKIKILTKENELLSKEIALLKMEIEQLKNKDTKTPPQGRTKLSDIFVVGAKFSTRSETLSGPGRGATGTGTFTITSRDGDSFTATNTWKSEKDDTSGTGKLQGRITGPYTAKWRRVDAPNGLETEATLRKEGTFIDAVGRNATGLVVRVVMDVLK